MFGYLVSFHYYRNTDLDALAASTGRDDLTFFADSGAFSAHTLGQVISLEDYAGWLGRWRHRIHAYAGLDVLFDAEGTQRNTAALRELGLDPMPVFHLGSPLTAFKAYLAESPYVGVGGMASGTLTLRDARLLRYLDRLHGMAASAGVGLHGFGLSSWAVIRRWPWRSVDSSTPGIGYRYGRIQAYDPYTDRWFMWSLRDQRAWHRHGWLVREYGMAPAQFRGDNVSIRDALIQLAARSWSRAAKTLAGRAYLCDTSTGDRGGERGPTWMAMWERGNRWDTRVYVTDAALAQRQGAGTRIGALDRGNRWGTPGATSGPVPASAAPPAGLGPQRTTGALGAPVAGGV